MFRMPLGDIADPAPGADARPQFGVAAGHLQGHVSAPAHPDQVDAGGIDAGFLLCPGHRLDDILDRPVRSHGQRGFVRAPEVWVDEGPPLLDAPVGIGGVFVCGHPVCAPGVQSHQQGFGCFIRRGVPHGGLGCAVAARDLHFFSRAGPGSLRYGRRYGRAEAEQTGKAADVRQIKHPSRLAQGRRMGSPELGEGKPGDGGKGKRASPTEHGGAGRAHAPGPRARGRQLREHSHPRSRIGRRRGLSGRLQGRGRVGPLRLDRGRD